MNIRTYLPQGGCMRGVGGVVALLLVAASAWVFAGQAPAAGGGVLFDGERLIIGDGRVIESAAMLVQNNRIARVGRKGEVPLPPGAARVDLTGKTVMPAIIDPHNHLGYTNQKTGASSKENFTRATII